MERRGAWIWRDRGIGFGTVDEKLDANVYVQFRRTLRLDAVPAAALARISADGRYRLFVNGVYIGRGPARCEPLFQYVDTHDLAPRLRAGDNVIAVLVHAYGRDMSWYELPRTQWSRALGCGGFYFDSDALGVATGDGAWRCRVADEWERDTPAGSVGFAEVYDARLAPHGWTAPDFDDAAWAAPAVLAAPGIGMAPDMAPFPHMVARDIPFLLEEARDAVAVASITELALVNARDMIALAEAAPSPLAACAVRDAGALLHGDGAADVRLAPGRAVSLVVNFGRDVSGYPRIKLDGPAGAAVNVSYSERLRPDGRVTVQRPNPITGQNVHRYILRDGHQSWEKFDRAGFRYLQLTLSPAPDRPHEPLSIRRANVNFTSYPVGGRGTFACSDDALTRIWRAGAYTLQLCMQDGFEDCPSREQRQWVGDAYVESLVNYACFGDAQLTAKLIRQVAQSQRRDGMTQMATPSDMSARWPLYIVDYCLSWIMTIAAYVLHTGDDAIVTGVFPEVVRAVAWFERHVGGDDLLVEPPGWIFIDWAEVDKRGACAALNALLVAALYNAAAMADHEHAAAHAARWRALAARIVGALNARLWDEARGVYVDALVAGEQSRRVSQHANAAMIMAGVAPPERWARMLDYILDAARLVETSTEMLVQPAAFDEERNVVLAQPFFSHFVHRALALAGRHDAIVENIRARWLPMLDADGTETLWEHWHGRESRCHAWSATPVYDLSREVVGVRPLAPGYASFSVEPYTAGLAWAEGRYPSPRGDIGVAWRIAEGRFVLELDVPPGSEARVVLPRGVTAPDGQTIVSGLGTGHHEIAAGVSS